MNAWYMCLHLPQVTRERLFARKFALAFDLCVAVSLSVCVFLDDDLHTDAFAALRAIAARRAQQLSAAVQTTSRVLRRVGKHLRSPSARPPARLPCCHAACLSVCTPTND